MPWSLASRMADAIATPFVFRVPCIGIPLAHFGLLIGKSIYLDLSIASDDSDDVMTFEFQDKRLAAYV